MINPKIASWKKKKSGLDPSNQNLFLKLNKMKQTSFSIHQKIAQSHFWHSL